MRLEFLFLVAGAAAAPRLSLLPPPLGLILPQDEGPPKISCLAPRSFAGSTFELFVVGAGVATRSVVAEPDQHVANFPLDEATGPSRCYRCRYRRFDGRSWQVSAFSAEIAVTGDTGGCHPPTAAPTNQPSRQDPSWLIPVAAGAAGLVLVVVTVAVLVTWRVKARRRRVKREEASCWTETRFSSTDLSYDNGAFTAGVIQQPRGIDNRVPASSPPTSPHFSTFRSST